MAVGDSTTDMTQHITKQQRKITHTNISPISSSASRNEKAHGKDHKASWAVLQQHKNISTSTAYVKDTNVMEVTYTQLHQTNQEPLYTATHLPSAINFLATNHLRSTPTEPTLASSINPFSLDPIALATWHKARTTLSDPTYFYTTMWKNFPAPGEPRPEPEERFAVRTLECTLEIEQGLADLRQLLKQCQRAEDEVALEGLRARVRWAVQGLG